MIHVTKQRLMTFLLSATLPLCGACGSTVGSGCGVAVAGSECARRREVESRGLATRAAG